MDNGLSPYTDLLDAFGSEGGKAARAGALQLYLGIVTSVSPLEVSVNGTPQRAAGGKLWCNPALLPEDVRAARLDGLSGRLGASVNCSRGSISQLTATGSGSLSGTLALADHGFAAGDTLLLLSRDQQTFYILCKEVPL